MLATVNRLIHRANELSDPFISIALADYLGTLERVLGPDHPNTLTSRNNLAAAYRHQGRHLDALRAFEEGASSAERLFGPAHQVTRQIVANRDAARRLIAEGGNNR